MRSSLKVLLDRLASLLHPRSDQLIALNDGELTKKDETRIRAHVEQCSNCQQRILRLLDGLRLVDHSSNSSAPSFSIEEGLARLSVAIRDRAFSEEQRTSAQQPEVSALLHTRLLSELSIYLGCGTATRLLDTCNHSLSRRDRVSAVIGPVVKTFLGEDAGDAVLANILRIWDTTSHVASEGLAQ